MDHVVAGDKVKAYATDDGYASTIKRGGSHSIVCFDNSDELANLHFGKFASTCANLWCCRKVTLSAKPKSGGRMMIKFLPP